jgi:xanthine dehydrogenase molybdopterin-binding subunit B
VFKIRLLFIRLIDIYPGGSFGGKDAQAMNVAGPAAVAAYK